MDGGGRSAATTEAAEQRRRPSLCMDGWMGEAAEEALVVGLR